MSDEQPTASRRDAPPVNNNGLNPPPVQGEEVGWRVLDPDGNVVASGPISEARAAGWLAELIENAKTEVEQQ